MSIEYLCIILAVLSHCMDCTVKVPRGRNPLLKDTSLLSCLTDSIPGQRQKALLNYSGLCYSERTLRQPTSHGKVSLQTQLKVFFELGEFFICFYCEWAWPTATCRVSMQISTRLNWHLHKSVWLENVFSDPKHKPHDNGITWAIMRRATSNLHYSILIIDAKSFEVIFHPTSIPWRCINNRLVKISSHIMFVLSITVAFH